ncbi:hypothetical protein [Bifidobacterium choerinum]|uniref:DUF559 domain-containing protein n=1 Tax=Bifidobacterium choerinum TaxID=35760 RepID=A0A087ADZ5_9BIFI|nr:hypothetical protein [Bifidobacterium choerinum]KFI56995.1 hypothetical protein BCHO_0669 [Bifidobacterium choerinum]
MGFATFGANDEYAEDEYPWDAVPMDEGLVQRGYGGRRSYPMLRANLRERTSQMMRRCKEADLPYAYCKSTALRLLGVETPEDLAGPGNAWDNAVPCKPGRQSKRRTNADVLHVIVRTAGERRTLPGVRMHVWNGLADDCVQLLANGICCLKPAAAWASVAMDATMLQLIQIAESMERYGLATLDELRAFVEAQLFHGKHRCRLALERYRIGLEYQGDQHRSDYRQYRRDRDKLGALAALGWRVFEVTQDDLNSEEALDRLAMRIMCVIARQTGGQPQITRLTYARIADPRRAGRKGV